MTLLLQNSKHMGIRVCKVKDKLFEMGFAYSCGLTEYHDSGKFGFLYISTVRE